MANFKVAGRMITRYQHDTMRHLVCDNCGWNGGEHSGLLCPRSHKAKPATPSCKSTYCECDGTARAVCDSKLAAAPSVTPYPDGNPKSIQGAKKFSLRLFPLPAAIVVNQALEDGMNKYGAANWRKTGVAASVYVDAAMRHLAQWFDGAQENAVDSGVHNLGHAMACLAIIVDAQANGTLLDDRPLACKDTDQLLLRS